MDIHKKEEFIGKDPESEKYPIKLVTVFKGHNGSGNEFVGQLNLDLQTPQGNVPHPLSFELEASTMEEAFSVFEKAAEKAIKEFKEEVQRQQSKIVTANQMPKVEGGNEGGIIDFGDLKKK